MVEATGDRWSYYLTAEEKSSYDEQMQNAYVGIGVTITAQKELGGMRIEAVTADGPAEEAGLLTGDIITEVEGEKTLDLGMTGTRTKVRGEEGTFVTLTILRGGGKLPPFRSSAAASRRPLRRMKCWTGRSAISRSPISTPAARRRQTPPWTS